MILGKFSKLWSFQGESPPTIDGWKLEVGAFPFGMAIAQRSYLAQRISTLNFLGITYLVGKIKFIFFISGSIGGVSVSSRECKKHFDWKSFEIVYKRWNFHPEKSGSQETVL